MNKRAILFVIIGTLPGCLFASSEKLQNQMMSVKEKLKIEMNQCNYKPTANMKRKCQLEAQRNYLKGKGRIASKINKRIHNNTGFKQGIRNQRNEYEKAFGKSR